MAGLVSLLNHTTINLGVEVSRKAYLVAVLTMGVND
jgi:hypothetical protein